MTSPLFLVSTDWHLRRDNIDKVIQLVSSQCQLAQHLNLNEIVVLGDVFDDRKSQTQDVLIAFYKIQETCRKYKIKLIVIPGNHDKTDYESENSFLHSFQSHKSCQLISVYNYIDRGGYRFHFLPYFEENGIYKEYLKKVQYTGRDVLFSHIALTGSVNNDYTIVNNSLLASDFNRFKHVFLGHYHNTHKLASNIVHLASLYQRNYGEDNKKGYTIIYDDLSYELIKSEFMQYISVEVNVSNLTTEQIINHVAQYNTKRDHVRLVLMGTTNECKNINNRRLEELGFCVQTKATDILNNSEVVATKKIKPFSAQTMQDYFREYCVSEHIDCEQGLSYLHIAFR